MDIQTKKELLIYFEQFITKKRKERILATLSLRTRHVVVVLEDLYQLANSSAIMRTCDALGVQDVHCIEGRNQFDINAGIALGASKWLTIDRYCLEQDQANNPTAECLKELKKEGYKLVATSPHATKSLSELAVEDKTAFLFGTEDQGLTETALNVADEVVIIPMYGFVESFNVSVSAALCLYDFTKRLSESTVQWQLNNEERFDLQLDWARACLEKSEQLERRFFTEHRPSH